MYHSIANSNQNHINTRSKRKERDSIRRSNGKEFKFNYESKPCYNPNFINCSALHKTLTIVPKFQSLLHKFIILVCSSDLLKWEVGLECSIWLDHFSRFCQKFKAQIERFPSEKRSYTL
ncbi:hypothetical protein QVD17_20176 [Tagetes erecta]|uniref:Uncharacterized protein n=1 Tax=Tagetes erecta TaxID=13708 RepID=A0AAD8KL24_TARER|nr:hypothetical protein QVD17_20176 [Tagetes erecta]